MAPTPHSDADVIKLLKSMGCDIIFIPGGCTGTGAGTKYAHNISQSS
jgi:hypothetical protein